MSKLVYTLIKEYIPIRDTLKEKENGNFFIVANKSSDIYYLNNMAKEIYSLIDNKLSIQEIYEKIKSEYDIDELELKNDIVEFIRDLQWKHLIKLKEVVK